MIPDYLDRPNVITMILIGEYRSQSQKRKSCASRSSEGLDDVVQLVLKTEGAMSHGWNARC